EGWANRSLYRSAFIYVNESNLFKLWYGGKAFTVGDPWFSWFIGFTENNFSDMPIYKFNVVPTIIITSPSLGAVFIAPASFTIKARASDSDGSVTKVEFYNGETLIGTDAVGISGEFSIGVTNLDVGAYTLTAKAYDNNGAFNVSLPISITVKKPNVAPTAAITSPSAGAIFTEPATVAITATAADSDGSIKRVEFYNGAVKISEDTTAPYTASLTGLTAGTYSLTAKAIDNEDAVGTSPAISITVKKPNVIPTAAITSPTAGTIFTEPAAVAITATAADSDGTIKRVEFYNGINLIGTDTSPPYEINWQNIIEGTYLLSAKAIDNEDASGTSEQIAIIVKKPAQQLLSCGGQEPEVKEGTIKGLSQYLSGTAQVTSWTYSPAADLTTSCLWRCDANLSYVKDENSCKLKDVFHINDLRVDQSNKDIKVTNILNNEILFILNNVTTSEIDLKNITLIANNLSESRTYLIVSNLTLPENKTKTLYVKKRDANSNALCINDRADLKNKDEILANCEKILCPRTLGGIYNCSLEGGIYIVLGLKNSGVIEDIITTSQPPPGPGGL
ncbi:MAG: Ig-like domain-containing protein, partial [Patescibacteria group bacterium]